MSYLMRQLMGPYMHASLKDGDDLPGAGDVVDRGDSLEGGDEKPPNAEEKKVAEDLKAKEAEKVKAKEDEEDEGEEKTRKDTRIPLARHKEILEEERVRNAQLTAKLAQYEGAQDIEKTNAELTKAQQRLIGLEAEHAKLLTDGKVDEAARKMGEIRDLTESVNDIRVNLKVAAAESRAYERARYDTTVDRIQTAYPVLNDDNKDHEDAELRFNPSLVSKVLRVAKAYQLDGMTPSDALQEAVKDLLGEPKTAKQKEAVEVKPRVSEAEAKKAQREEEARVKAAEAAKKQPASDKSVGKDSDKMGGGGSLSAADVLKLSYSDFAKLDEKTLSAMRGDVPE
jgi:hypothetical protein